MGDERAGRGGRPHPFVVPPGAALLRLHAAAHGEPGGGRGGQPHRVRGALLRPGALDRPLGGGEHQAGAGEEKGSSLQTQRNTYNIYMVIVVL